MTFRNIIKLKQTLNSSIVETQYDFRVWFTHCKNVFLSKFNPFFPSLISHIAYRPSKSKLWVKNGHRSMGKNTSFKCFLWRQERKTRDMHFILQLTYEVLLDWLYLQTPKHQKEKVSKATKHILQCLILLTFSHIEASCYDPSVPH